MKKDYGDLKNFSFALVTEEMMRKLPLLFRIICGITLTRNDLLIRSHKKIQELIPRWALIYGILMQSNFHELSLVQQVMTSILEDNLCHQKVYKKKSYNKF
jgi:hypothetical protein